MASEIKVDTIVNAGGDNDSGIDLATNDNIKFNIAGSQKAIIDATGNVGINSTTPSTYVDGSDGQTLVLESAGTERGAIVFASECTGGEGEILGLINFTDTANSSTNKRGAAIRGIRGSSDTNPFLTFTTADTERMRIKSSGVIMIPGTHTDGSGSERISISVTSGSVNGINFMPTGASGTNTAIACRTTGGSFVGGIQHNNTSTSFPTSSDYRLKENVVTEWDATTRLKQLKPSRFNFKVESDKTQEGFLAHEVSSIVPEAVNGEKDAVDKNGNIEPQSIDHSKLVPLLTKALQEAVTKIETLEAKVTALESK